MFEQDYIMRLIKEMVRAIIKLLFNVDTQSPTSDLIENTQTRTELEALLKTVDTGEINSAENRLYELVSYNDMDSLKAVLLFYSHLNDKSDAFLEEHNFSREEVELGIRDMLSRFGLETVADLLLLEL